LTGPDLDVVSIYRSECLEQPQRLRELFQAYATGSEIRSELEKVKAAVTQARPLVWLGMGASFCSSISGAAKLSLCGRPSFAVEASEWLHFALSTWDRIAGPILVTTSGESVELVELCVKTEKHPRILICNFPESSCWKAAEIRLPILAGEENGNATKTYTNSTAICTILASELIGESWHPQAARVTDGFAQSLEHAFDRRGELEAFSRGTKTIEVVARGSALAGALMGALCIREMSTWRANGHSGGSFRHGPFLDVDSTHLAIILGLGRTADMGRRLAADCVAKGGKALLVVDHGVVSGSEGLLTIKLEPVPDGWEGLTSVLVPQALTLALIERFGSSYVRGQTTIQ
jgi:glutamine---fructose-6-phosphate transaminase (isomerizing)